MFIFMV